MEIKINKEIKDYTESIFFGLSLRQFVFSVIALIAAVGLYFLLRPYFSIETLSWVCILGAAPFAALGFINYHGMKAEQLLWACLKSEFIEPKRISCKPTTLYYETLKDNIAKREKEAKKNAEHSEEA